MLVPGDQRGRAGHGWPGRGTEGGVEQRPAELVKRLPHGIRILRPLAHRLKGREQLAVPTCEISFNHTSYFCGNPNCSTV